MLNYFYNQYDERPAAAALTQQVEWGESPHESVTVMPGPYRIRISQIHCGLDSTLPEPDCLTYESHHILCGGIVGVLCLRHGAFLFDQCVTAAPPLLWFPLGVEWGRAGRTIYNTLPISLHNSALCTKLPPRFQDRLGGFLAFIVSELLLFYIVTLLTFIAMI